MLRFLVQGQRTVQHGRAGPDGDAGDGLGFVPHAFDDLIAIQRTGNLCAVRAVQLTQDACADAPSEAVGQPLAGPPPLWRLGVGQLHVQNGRLALPVPGQAPTERREDLGRVLDALAIGADGRGEQIVTRRGQ
jgi:hypothetical protein